MVKSGHARTILEVGFQNSRRPGSGVEVLQFSEIVRRVGARRLDVVERADFHTLVLYLAGRCSHMVDFTQHPCRRGTALMVQAGQVHRWGVRPGVEAVVVVFTREFLFPERPRLGALWQERFFDDVAWPARLALDVEGRAAAVGWARTLERTYARLDSAALSLTLMRHLLSAALLDLATRAELQAELPGHASPEVARARKFRSALQRSYRVTRSVQDYARHLGCSAKTLDRTCRALLGASAKSCIDARVALEARRLLAHTEMTAAAIGEELGFSEPTNFVKFFKSRSGVLPGRFRERNRAATSAP